MSATPSRPPPTPGLLVLVQPRSWVPNPEASGEPISKPWPGMVAQFTPSVRPASVQVEELMPLLTTPEPGKVRYVAEILPEGPNASKAEVSYQPLETLVWALGLRTVS